jgi:hypothetical protein
VAFAYGAILALAVDWSFVELWTKSYDLPVEQRRAKASAIGIFVAAAYAVANFAIAAGSQPLNGRAALTWMAFLPPWFALAWCVHEVDWRYVYVSAIVGSVLPVLCRVPLPPLQAGVPVATALLVAAMAARAERESVRTRRYTRRLRLWCSCCGDRQKAVRELCALGREGEKIVREYLRHNSESRVESELSRCCLLDRVRRQ